MADLYNRTFLTHARNTLQHQPAPAIRQLLDAPQAQHSSTFSSPDHSHEGKGRQGEVPRHQRPAQVHGFPFRHHLGSQVTEEEVHRADKDGQPGAVSPQPQPPLTGRWSFAAQNDTPGKGRGFVK